MSISEVAINADLSRLSATQTVINEVLAQWPEHARFLKSRFRDVSASMTATTEEVAALVLKLAGPRLAEMCKNYCWMCQNFLEDEFHFRRTGEYRLKSFDEAYRHVYSKREYMSRYIDGILLSQVLWHNHAAALHHFITDFLRAVPAGSSYLEVGPGHGLFTYFAARSGHFQRLVGWDVSAASIQATQSALDVFGIGDRCELVQCNILDRGDSPADQFDRIVISEVLEHLEDPLQALQTLFHVARPDARIFINVPVNSPAPDHIYLWRTPEDAVETMRSAGFEIDSVVLAPGTGYTSERARKMEVTISCLITAVRP
jgi:2-polyprenyl-3-methyl-5-hydroxy-6-metoxy-1,4-benzoquinol methylase